MISSETNIISKNAFICFLTLLATMLPWLAFAQDQPGIRRCPQEELDQMLAPIALYPDSLLAQILMAATYPLEVVEAERWARANKNLTHDQLNDGLDQKSWDPSVKALVPFPQVLSVMSENLEWTEELGDAFLDQQEEVMDTIQELRSKAETAGNLKDTQEQKVISEDNEIEIEPSDPEVVYVPVYDPASIYGSWWYPDFPSFYFLPPSWMVIAFHGGIGFGRGIVLGKSWGRAWGHWDWRNHHMNVNINRSININRTNIQTTQWQHDPSHRKGVFYKNEATRDRYGQSVKGVENRRDFRGFETKTQQSPGITRPVTAQTRSRQTPAVSQQGLDRSRDRSAFGSMDHGSTVQRQSDRGRQSRQSAPSNRASSVSRGNVSLRR